MALTGEAEPAAASTKLGSSGIHHVLPAWCWLFPLGAASSCVQFVSRDNLQPVHKHEYCATFIC